MDPESTQHGIPQALQNALLDPARRDQTVTVDGEDVRLRFDPEPGVHVRMELPQAPGGMAFTTYKATDERPASYPPELPFLPGVAASVTGRGGNASVQWWNVPDVEGALAGLRAHAAADGWAEGAETRLDFLPSLRILNFQRADGTQRVVHVTPTGGGTMIQLVHGCD